MMYFILLVIFAHSRAAKASAGDSSRHFQECLGECALTFCPKRSDFRNIDLQHESWSSSQPWYLALLLWRCEDECKYDCMWGTVKVFEQHDVPCPQFYGKWPFIRILGVQEPAAALFSVLNGVAHFLMLQKFVQAVPSDAPNFRLWCAYSLVCINAWFWSAVFHTRDFPFTEKMDYFSALSGLLFSLYAFVIRLTKADKRWKYLLPGTLCLLFFTFHVSYLSFVKFDYGYNMLANIGVGVLSSAGWIGLCLWKIATGSGSYWWSGALSIIFVNSLMGLELYDFPPLLWSFDAHALWHLGTIPFPWLWYRFVITDSLSLKQSKLKKV